MKEGVLPIQELRESAGRHEIVQRGQLVIPREQFQPASLDLTIGEQAYRLRSSFLPMNGKVAERLEEFRLNHADLRDGVMLEANRPYLVMLNEVLGLPPGVMARANPRSSTGRMDIFTRMVADGADRFDETPPGYRGPLYLEIVSRSFTILIRHGMSMNQIRLIRGNPGLGPPELAEEHGRFPLALLGGKPMELTPADLEGGVPLSVDLSGGRDGIVGYRARRNSGLLDLTSSRPHNRDDFWEPLRAEQGRRLVLEPEEFYLICSRESVRVPPYLAAEMVVTDTGSGEFRAHYAGFFDPGFGCWPDETRAVMELRAHDVPFALEHGQRVCRLRFERLTERAELVYGPQVGSRYQGQGIRLSRAFS